jgi:large subunit ribosomal protein L25
MATVKELKATARPQSGKGAARAERRAGRVPGVIYGNNQPPVTISVDDKELRQRILAGRFLTTLFDIDLEGKKHRVIPRDFHLDPVRDFPLHVDFMRLGEGATIRVSVPLRVQNGESSPGVKRGGTVNIVTHTIDLECSVDNIPQYIEADVGALEISHSLHLSEIKLPTGVKSLSREDATPKNRRLRRLLRLQARPLRRRVLRRRLLLRLRRVLRLRRLARKRRLVATRRSKQRQDAASCACLSVSVTPVRNTRTTGTTSDSWPSMKSRGVTVSHRGAAVFRARLPMVRSMAKRSFCFGRPPT